MVICRVLVVLCLACAAAPKRIAPPSKGPKPAMCVKVVTEDGAWRMLCSESLETCTDDKWNADHYGHRIGLVGVSVCVPTVLVQAVAM